MRRRARKASVVTHGLTIVWVTQPEPWRATAKPPLKRTTRAYRWLQRFFRKLPRRAIQATGFAVSIVGIGWLVAGQMAGLAVFGTGCYFIAHPFESGPLMQLAIELVRSRWGSPAP